MRTAFVLLALGLTLAGCGGTREDAAATAQDSAEKNAAGYFKVPEQQLSHLQLVPASETTWTTSFHTTGTVDWDNDRTTQAITQVSGPITRILVDTGAHVKRGDVLLYVSSPDMANAVSAYRKAKNRLELAKRNLDRNKDLLNHEAISQREYESVEADYNDAATDVQTALQSLKVLDVSAQDLAEAERQGDIIHPELAMRAPISGTVVQKLVLPGQVIEAGSTAAFVISDVSTVWVQGHVYEKDLRSIHKGDRVELRNASFPIVFHGTVAYIGDMLDPTTRTTPVRIVTPNTEGLLKKDLFLDITVTDQSERSALVVPTSSVLYDEQNFPFVYVQVQRGQFAQRQVTLGGQQKDHVEIVQGLKPGEQVVAEGSLFLQFASSFQG
jgi:cobalt-zinc-cadmium efflux system membrane fusion protein